MFAIEKNVKVPKKGEVLSSFRGVYAKTLEQMKVGDSFVVPKKTATRNAVQASVSKYAKVLKVKCSLRSFNKGTRVWRVK